MYYDARLEPRRCRRRRLEIRRAFLVGYYTGIITTSLGLGIIWLVCYLVT